MVTRPPAAGGLTSREHEVLALVCRGWDDKRIGAELGISPNTARTHVQNILSKRNVHSKVALVASVDEAGRLRALVDAHHGGPLGVAPVQGRCPVCVLAGLDPDAGAVVKALLGGGP